MKNLVLCLATLLSFVGCGRSPSPSTSALDEPSPVLVRILVSSPRFAELVGDHTIDVSSMGDFTRRTVEGNLVENELVTHNEEFPATAHISRREGEQACRVAPLLSDKLNLRLRHWNGAPLTSDDCRDIGQFVDAYAFHVTRERYTLAFHHVEADGKGCSYTVTARSY